MILADERHDQNMLFEYHNVWTVDSDLLHSHHVVHLLFGPHIYDNSVILLRKSVLEPVVILDVSIALLEFVEGRLENFYGTFSRQE